MVIMDLKKDWELSEGKKCCTDCKTTKTPLWRGGPAGPKTLCNACGIRYRKRRASTVGMNKGQERKRVRVENGSSSSSSDDDVCGSYLNESLKENLMPPLGEEVWLQRSSSSLVIQKQRSVFVGEEEQAAFCLMALSCGFVFA